ncbi:MAG: hypothetical protein LBH17_04585 [Oscillospiraceae bacterium]|jgi:hypothetical protein|nr:hypothetical protein [Oscillospiraceae bacterium]
MRRAGGDSFIKLITGLLFAAFTLYCGLNVYRSLENPFRTAPAVALTLSETASARGFIVREEELLPGDFSFASPRLDDGEKAARGQLVAELYSIADTAGTDAYSGYAASERIEELETRIKKLHAAAAASPEELARRTENAVTTLAYLTARRDLTAAAELAIEAESLVTGASGNIGAESEAAALEAELDALQIRHSGATPVYAPVSGVFARSVDGFEGITPSGIANLTPDELEALFAFPEGQPGAGRLITGTRWYLALVMDSASAAALIEPDSVTVRLTTPVRAEFTMRVEDVGRGSGDRRVVTLSCDYGMRDILNVRATDAEIVYGEISGLRVPRDAVRLEPPGDESGESGANGNGTDGNLSALETYVYIAEGHRAKRVRVTILRDYGTAYIVQGRSSILRDGSEVIVKANGLYDGKVVR